jgi:hypothetical protein
MRTEDTNCEVRTARTHPGQSLVATLTLGIAVLIVCARLFGAAVYTNIVAPFHLSFPLSPTQSLEIGAVPDCPPVTPGMACLPIEQQSPRVFRVVYWSTGTKYTVVSIPLRWR